VKEKMATLKKEYLRGILQQDGRIEGGQPSKKTERDSIHGRKKVNPEKRKDFREIAHPREPRASLVIRERGGDTELLSKGDASEKSRREDYGPRLFSLTWEEEGRSPSTNRTSGKKERAFSEPAELRESK